VFERAGHEAAYVSTQEPNWQRRFGISGPSLAMERVAWWCAVFTGYAF
jgi:hypothetical protein